MEAKRDYFDPQHFSLGVSEFVTSLGGVKNPAEAKSKAAKIRDWKFTRVVDEIWFLEKKNGERSSAQNVRMRYSIFKETNDSNYRHVPVHRELYF